MTSAGMLVVLFLFPSGERERAASQEETVEPQDPVPPPVDAVDKSLPLTLEEYVRLVLARNLDLKITRVDTEISAAEVLGQQGAFDPEAYLTATGAFAEIPSASRFASSNTQDLLGSFGFRGLLRTGTQYDLSYTGNYNRQIDENPFFTLNPRVLSTVLLSVTQPLLRGAGPTVVESLEQQNYLFYVQGDLNLRWNVEETAFLAVQSYWNLVFELRSLTTAETALEVAQELVENNRRKQTAGVMTRLDVLTAQAEEARRRQALIEAQTRVGDAKDALKALLSPGEQLEDWSLGFAPSTEPALREGAPPDPADVVRNALANRTDLSATEIDRELADLALEVAENGLLPQFDVTGNFGYSGLGGDETVFGPDLDGDGIPDPIGTSGDSNADILGESLTQIRDGTFERWSVGVSLSYPIGNRRARADYRKARLQKERALLSLANQRTLIVQDSRAAVRDVEQARAQVEAARTARELAEQQYEAELIRFENQRSTTFQVREAQRDMFEARDQETSAIVSYEIFLARLAQVQGSLGEQFGVAWLPVPKLEGAIE